MEIWLGNRLLVGKRSERIRLIDWLLIIGLTLAPMTGLRVGKVGPAEALCALWAIRFAFKSKFRMTDIFRFFIGFLGSLLVGTAIGYLIARNELRISGLFTWGYLSVVAVLMYDGLSNNSSEYNDKLLNAFAAVAVIWQLFLYIYSKNVSRTFLGSTLWYHGVRYSGGGTNPHQVAVLLCGAFPIFARNVIKRRQPIINIALAGVSIFLLGETSSSTGIMAVALCVLLFAAMLIVNVGSRRKRIQYIAIMLLLVLLVVLFFYQKIYDYIMEWIEEDSNGMGRLQIYSSFGRTFRKSALFGLGPGEHAFEGVIEYHNTYLEILAATGICGMVFFLIYTVRSIKKLWRADWTLVPAVIAIYAYGLAGFAMRRLVYWGIMVLTTAVASAMLKEERYSGPLYLPGDDRRRL